jgi:hypothetical protein
LWWIEDCLEDEAPNNQVNKSLFFHLYPIWFSDVIWDLLIPDLIAAQAGKRARRPKVHASKAHHGAGRPARTPSQRGSASAVDGTERCQKTFCRETLQSDFRMWMGDGLIDFSTLGSMSSGRNECSFKTSQD